MGQMIMNKSDLSIAMYDLGDEKVVVDKPKAILLKIIGVVCKTSYKNKLVNYSIENSAGFLDKHLFDPNILKLMPKIKKFYENCKHPDCPIVPWTNFLDILNVEDQNQRKKLMTDRNPVVIDFKRNFLLFLHWSFESNTSSSPVNELQNFIWLEGYSANRLKAEFYQDVPSKLQEWRDSSIKIFTFSSGTVYAQQVTFTNSTFGNLLGLLDGQISSSFINLDKRETLCYGTIAEILNEERKSILFISPSIKEVKAATLSGFKTILMRREKRLEMSGEISFRGYINIIHNFDQIVFK